MNRYIDIIQEIEDKVNKPKKNRPFGLHYNTKAKKAYALKQAIKDQTTLVGFGLLIVVLTYIQVM